ncbi:hypothetical protein LXA43DRAFT_85717 [Ganoderma leucocontextum]|nr:hypothetical protein LXA43DRAFT_85717 [Ganoderma leucocontextum]
MASYDIDAPFNYLQATGPSHGIGTFNDLLAKDSSCGTVSIGIEHQGARFVEHMRERVSRCTSESSNSQHLLRRTWAPTSCRSPGEFIILYVVGEDGSAPPTGEPNSERADVLFCFSRVAVPPITLQTHASESSPSTQQSSSPAHIRDREQSYTHSSSPTPALPMLRTSTLPGLDTAIWPSTTSSSTALRSLTAPQNFKFLARFAAQSRYAQTPASTR